MFRCCSSSTLEVVGGNVDGRVATRHNVNIRIAVIVWLAARISRYGLTDAAAMELLRSCASSVHKAMIDGAYQSMLFRQAPVPLTSASQFPTVSFFHSVS
jgi:hypothetical protein